MINRINAELRIYPARYLLESGRTGSNKEEYWEACAVLSTLVRTCLQGDNELLKQPG